MPQFRDSEIHQRAEGTWHHSKSEKGMQADENHGHCHDLPEKEPKQIRTGKIHLPLLAEKYEDYRQQPGLASYMNLNLPINLNQLNSGPRFGGQNIFI